MHNSPGQSLAVGFFDGVHRGHQAILSEATAALTFRRHPLEVICPERAPRLIMSFAEREAALRANGIEKIIALDFTPELAQMEPQAFAERYLRGFRICCGANWHFGRRGLGNVELLRSWGFAVCQVPFAEYQGEAISSTRIREAIEAGDLEAATAMLGHPLALGGTIEPGKGAGRSLGFPTVNVRPDFLKLRLPRGVYAVECAGQPAIANFGVAPTFGPAAWTEPRLEVHFLQRELPRLDSPLRVELRRFLRAERTFASLKELQAQIQRDCDQLLKG